MNGYKMKHVLVHVKDNDNGLRGMIEVEREIDNLLNLDFCAYFSCEHLPLIIEERTGEVAARLFSCENNLLERMRDDKCPEWFVLYAPSHLFRDQVQDYMHRKHYMDTAIECLNKGMS